MQEENDEAHEVRVCLIGQLPLRPLHKGEHISFYRMRALRRDLAVPPDATLTVYDRAGNSSTLGPLLPR